MPGEDLQSKIKGFLLELPQFEGAAIDVHMMGDGAFVVQGEDASGSSLPVRTGQIHSFAEGAPAITWTEDHTLTDEQAQIYQRALSHISKQVIEGRERGEARIQLLETNAFPEIFETSAPDAAELAKLRPDNAAVWWNIQSSLKLWGYDEVIQASEESGASLVWAEAAETPPQ